MLISLLLNQSAVYCKLFHFKEAMRCCDDALRLTQKSAEVYYRRSQAATYNRGSSIEQLEAAKRDIDQAISMRPGEEKYKKHKGVLEGVVEAKLQTESKAVDWVVRCALKRLERAQKASGAIELKPEKPLELKILKKYGI